LLSIIAQTQPASLQELADRTGGRTSNLSRTLKTMEHYGFVRLHRGERGRIRPEVPYQAVTFGSGLRRRISERMFVSRSHAIRK
jgi:predicted transcriptional regulator